MHFSIVFFVFCIGIFLWLVCVYFSIIAFLYLQRAWKLGKPEFIILNTWANWQAWVSIPGIVSKQYYTMIVGRETNLQQLHKLMILMLPSRYQCMYLRKSWLRPICPISVIILLHRVQMQVTVQTKQSKQQKVLVDTIYLWYKVLHMGILFTSGVCPIQISNFFSW